MGGNFNMTVEAIVTLIERHDNHSKFHKLYLSGHKITDEYEEPNYKKEDN